MYICERRQLQPSSIYINKVYFTLISSFISVTREHPLNLSTTRQPCGPNKEVVMFMYVQ